MKEPAYKTSREPIINPILACAPTQWPKAESTKCFILEAINIVGKAMLGADWLDNELLVSSWLVQPEYAHAVNQTNRLRPRPALDIPLSLSSHSMHRALSIPKSHQFNAHMLAFRKFRSDLQIEEDVRAEQQAWEANRDAYARLSKVADWLAQKCRDAELKSFYRFTTGGKLVSMEAEDWNLERIVTTFLANGGYKRWFANLDRPRQFEVYIFFDRAELEKATAVFEHSSVKPTEYDLHDLSPLLKLAVKIALAKGYKSSSQPDTAATREWEVRAAWPDNIPEIPMTDSMVKAIAKVMGFPNAKAVMQGQQAHQKKGFNP